jgi:hypothetical protein
LEFCFLWFFFFFLPSVSLAGNYAIWSAEDLQARLEMAAGGLMGLQGSSWRSGKRVACLVGL